jgi:diguanylate cyclase (GGDEF)-like protein
MRISSPDQVDPCFLIVIYSRDATLLGRRYALGPSPAVTTVGRHTENTIVLDSDGVSRRHARFEQRADGWWVVDSDSTNGTLVNDEKVQGARLRYGDHIRVGDTIFKLLSADDGQEVLGRPYSFSLVDGLTKAYNRRYLTEQIHREVERAVRSGRPLALVMFDLDHFKKLNDTRGHLAGDQVLREIASLTQKRVRTGEVFARYGGEEFALLLPGTDLQGAVALAEEIRAEVAAHAFAFEGHTSSMTISVGVARVDEDTRVADDLIRSADEKLYAAKLGGRNRVLPEARVGDSPSPRANLLLRDRILNCGSEGVKRAAPRVRFAFACPKRWETLAPTEAESVRVCQQCNEHVYHCKTVAEAASHALAGQCIAIPKYLSDAGVESDLGGRPDPLAEWAERLFPPETKD